MVGYLFLSLNNELWLLIIFYINTKELCCKNSSVCCIKYEIIRTTTSKSNIDNSTEKEGLKLLGNSNLILIYFYRDLFYALRVCWLKFTHSIYFWNFLFDYYTFIYSMHESNKKN